MREKAIPFRSLPIEIVIWERLVKPKPKPKFATKVKAKDQRYNPIKWKKESILKESPTSGYFFLLQNESNDESSLTALQKYMIRIVKENGGSASIDTLLDEVQKIWDKISIGEEWKFIPDSRRAVFATLANSPNNPIFVRDLEKGEGWWKLGKKATEFNMEAIEESSNQMLHHHHEHDNSTNDEMSNNEDEDDEEDADVIEDEEDEEEDVVTMKLVAVSHNNDQISDSEERVIPLSKRRRHPTAIQQQVEKVETSSIEVKTEQESQKDESKENLTDNNEISQLQGLMIEAIIKNGCVASVDTMQKHVAKFWPGLRKKDSSLPNIDSRKAVRTTLASNNTIFAPDTQREGYWRVTKSALDTFESVKEQVTDIPRLTGMQDMLMRILLAYGGVCTFEQIYDEAAKNGKSTKHLGTDYKRVSRAILASLSHNPPGNFRKTADGTSWTIAPKAMAIAEQMSKEDPAYSLSKINLNN